MNNGRQQINYKFISYPFIYLKTNQYSLTVRVTYSWADEHISCGVTPNFSSYISIANKIIN